jgi:phage terminase small subunit
MEHVELTEKQRIFCNEYILDWNGSRAARVAGYSEATANVIASENLTKPYIQAYIKDLQADIEKIAGVSRLRVINEHIKLAFSSIAHLHNTWIERKDFELLAEDQKSCISEISTQTRTVFQGEERTPVEVEFIKIKLYDKQKALDSISKMLGYDAATKMEVKGSLILQITSDESNL